MQAAVARQKRCLMRRPKAWVCWFGVASAFALCLSCSTENGSQESDGGKDGSVEHLADGAPADAVGARVVDARGDPESGAEIDTRRTVEKFVSVQTQGGWGPCPIRGECWARSEVEAPGVMFLEDSHGEERFELTDEEYQAVLDVVFSAEFLEALAEPVKYACRPITDGGSTLTVTWTDIGADQIQIGGCLIGDEYADHPFNVLAELVGTYVVKYLKCEPYTVPEGWQMGVDPYPTRPMCYSCGERCGAIEIQEE